MLNRFFKSWQIPFALAWKTMRNNKGRSFLALLGVAVGVFAVVVVTVLGNAVQGFVNGQVTSFGTDNIQVEVKVPQTGKMSTENASSQAQGTQITTLTLDDYEDILKLPNVKAAYAGTIGQQLAEFGATQKRILLFGAGEMAPLVDENVKLSEGRFFTQEENESLAQVVALGSETKETFFGASEAVGESITLNGERYRVVGVLESRGSAGFFNLDTFTYIPIQTLQKKILGVKHVQMIQVKMDDPKKEAETVADIVALLRNSHDIDNPDEDDFAVTSLKEAQETLDSILGAMRVLLLALTSISLIVGGVGIMNVMYVSVTERTPEIGLRKAVGANSRDILRQFLLESVIITFVGGLLGIALGLLISFGASLAFAAAGIPLVFGVSFGPIILGASFSIIVGLVFGLAPAYQASRLSPMAAIRRE